jgi:hypothetical protein
MVVEILPTMKMQGIGQQLKTIARPSNTSGPKG